MGYWGGGLRFELSRLSKSYQSQGELFASRDQRWSASGVIQPLSQFAIGKQVQPQHRRQIGQRPGGLGEVVQPFVSFPQRCVTRRGGS